MELALKGFKLNLSCYISWDWLRKMTASGSYVDTYLDAYLVFVFTHLICHLEDTRCFLVARYRQIVRKPNLPKGFSISKYKNRGSFSATLRMKVCPYSYFRCCGHCRGPWVLFVATGESSVKVNFFFKDQWKNYFKDRSLMTSQPIFPIFTSFLTQWNGHIIKRT